VVVTVPGGGASATSSADRFTYATPATATRYDQTDPNIVKTGVWADYPASAAYNLSYGRSLTPGATATVYFTGTKIAWIGMKGVTPGIVDVYIDDVKKVTLDLYAASAQYLVTLWTSDILSDGPHHMDLVRNSASLSSEYLVLDAVDIWGTIAAAPPAITSVSPSSGVPAGGTAVTINGTSLIGATSVTFGGAPALFTVVSATKITATAPAHAAGPVTVQVTTPSGSASSSFTYAVPPATTRVDLVNTTALVTPGSSWSGTWASYTTASAFGGSYMRSSTAGAYVIISFKGTQLDLIATKGTTTGVADIYLDGATVPVTVSLAATAAAYKQTIYTTGTLADGYHAVRIQRSTTSATGKYLTLDAVDVAGTLTPITIQETDSHMAWAPAASSWTSASSTSYSGGSYRYSNVSGASVTVNFTGISLKLIAKKAASYGKVQVTLDGTTTFTVDLYSATTKYKQTVWTSGFLTPGDHTVKIERLLTKNASSSGYTIDVDAVDVIGVLK
jgi:hypothetical protein